MMNNSYSVDLSPKEIEVIEAALHTQEKILAVQSRADVDGSARARLAQLKGVMRTLRRQTPANQPQSWTAMARGLFG